MTTDEIKQLGATFSTARDAHGCYIFTDQSLRRLLEHHVQHRSQRFNYLHERLKQLANDVDHVRAEAEALSR